MIIIEGIDGTGKTTVANYLNDKGFSIYHFGFDEKNKEIDEKYLNLLEQNTANMVLDRCFISELVYRPCFKEQL